jgi:hypothetical protein
MLKQKNQGNTQLGVINWELRVCKIQPTVVNNGRLLEQGFEWTGHAPTLQD